MKKKVYRIFVTIALAIPLLYGSSNTFSANDTLGKRNSIVYWSRNLAGHSVAAECNPGGTSSCECSEEDVSLTALRRYGEVTSNPRRVHTYVNAIGYKKFIETLPNGDPISLDTYKYIAKVRLPAQPIDDNTHEENPEAVHMMIQLWDGRNELWESNKTTLEAAIYWDLNPWTPEGKEGEIKVYTNPITLVDTGIALPPDDKWHTFTIVADFESRRYVSITIDDETRDLQHLELAQVYHPDWGDEVALIITTESLASWPGETCDKVFTWTTQFKNLLLMSVNGRL